MPSLSVSQRMPCPSLEVFNLLHDYSLRLSWDTLLREARLTGGHTAAAKGATSLCVGKHLGGRVGIETRYVTFSPGVIAAVEMINHPPLFARFAASIRHENVAGESIATYRLHFVARPAALRWLLNPVLTFYLRHETRKRLRSLSRFLAASRPAEEDRAARSTTPPPPPPH